MHTDDLVRMANQIAGFFQSYPREEAVTETAGHIRSFWEPRMRQSFLEYVGTGGEGLHEIALQAAGLLKPAPQNA